MTVREFLSRLDSVRRVRGGWQARCPAHEDKDPSLSVSDRDGNILLKCFAGCSAESIMGALGLSMADLFAEPKPNGSGKRKGKANNGRGPCVATYIYTDADGSPVARKLRFEPGANGEKKTFEWERYENGEWRPKLAGLETPLYRLPAIQGESCVILTEGEKDADAGAAIGLPCTTSGGVNSWREDHAERLRGKAVVTVADADDAGRKEAELRAASLYGKAASVKVLGFADAKDLAEWIERGGTVEKFWQLVESASEWKPASGAEILDSVMIFIRRFVSLNEAQARAVVLWVAHTHAIEAADCTPYLNPNSAEKQSGKTRLLEVFEPLVSNPWLTGRVTAATLTRKIDDLHPTLLLDESDAAFKGEQTYAEALRGVLNTGYRRGGKASCCVGQGANMGYKDFLTFSAKAIAGIGSLPDTVADRSIPIHLKRARRGTVERWRERDGKREAAPIAAKLAAWAQANLERLREGRPDIPSALSDRQADVCEPLLAIADLAGGEWPKTARAALVKLCVDAQTTDESTGVQLLRDIKSVFVDKAADEIPSGELAEALAKIETSPWGEWSKGKPLSPAKLARLLKPFDIHPDKIKNNTARGYAHPWFQEAFSLYLPVESVQVSETRENSGENANSKVSHETPPGTFKNAASTNKNAPTGHFDTLKADAEGKKAGKERKKAVVEWEA